MKKTIKLPIILPDGDKEIIFKYQKNQNNVIRFTYNRLIENEDLTTKEISKLHSNLNNIFIDSHFKNSAIYKAKELSEKENIIFGGKRLFIQRCQDKISKDIFQVQKLSPIISIGESNQKGNRKFSILENNKILFKPEKKVHIEIKLPFLKKKLKKELNKLYILQQNHAIPITYQLDTNYIYISYEDCSLNQIEKYIYKVDRIMSLDLNPNYIGYSIIDWKNETAWELVDKGIFDLSYFSFKSKELKKLKYELKRLGKNGDERKEIILNKLKKLNNKRNYETIQIAIKIFNLFKGYNSSLFGIEGLDIKSKDNKKGKNYNRLINNEWLRKCLIDQLKKRFDRLNIKVIEILPNYSSFIGNLLYRNLKLPDPVLASLEINRRIYEFYKQYIEKSKPKEKTVIFPNFERVKPSLVKSLEEFNLKINSFENWIELYQYFKNSKVKYRVSLEDTSFKVFSLNNKKSLVELYSFA